MSNPLHPAERRFSQRFSSRRRSVRLARYLVCHQLDSWGVAAHRSAFSETAGLVISELGANAVSHGHVPGRDFEVTLLQPGYCGLLRIEVSDARGESRPDPLKLPEPAPEDESGRGLLLVTAVAAAWGVADRIVGKTVWVELPDPYAR